MIYRTRAAEYIDEAITIVCTGHKFEAVETDNGPGQRCSKCKLFHSDTWWSPQPIIAEIAPSPPQSPGASEPLTDGAVVAGSPGSAAPCRAPGRRSAAAT